MTETMLSNSMAALLGYLIPFVLFTFLGFLCAGRQAIQWSSDLVRSAGVNLLIPILNGLIGPFIMISVALVHASYEGLGLPKTPLAFWDQLPVWVGMLAWLITIDFCDYWIHRLLHTRGFWDVHAVHHSDETMNWTTSSRMHILEIVIMQSSYILFASWMNLPAEGVGAIVALRLLHNNWVHTRYDLHLGPLTKIIATPRFHHWHHADDPAAYNTNFGNTFSLWDVMFGTYRVPSAYTGKFGFEGTPGNNVARLMIWPYLQWLKPFAKKEQIKNFLLPPRSFVDRYKDRATQAIRPCRARDQYRKPRTENGRWQDQ